MSASKADFVLEVDFKGKPLNRISFTPGKSYCNTIKEPTHELSHQYHDEIPIARAECAVELEDGRSLHGYLDDFSQSVIRGMDSSSIGRKKVKPGVRKEIIVTIDIAFESGNARP